MTLIEQLRDKNWQYVITPGMGLATEAADEIEKLTRELANAQVSGIHSCHDGCTRSGCVNGRLRDALARVEVIMWHHGDEFPELRAVVQAALRDAK